MTAIRLEQVSDIKKIREINNSAFEQPQEGSIVDSLRNYSIGWR